MRDITRQPDILRQQKTDAEVGQGSLKSIEVLKLPEIRVSTAGFLTIQDSQGRQLLIINKDRLLRGGKRILNPVGGAIEATKEGAELVKSMLGIKRFESQRSPNDLRFVAQGGKLNDYRKWLLTRKGRETNPRREAIEELCQEELGSQKPPLLEQDLEEFNIGPVKYATELAKTDRSGNNKGALTLRFLEITPVVLSEATLRKLEIEAGKPEALIRFVTAQEILNGQTSDGDAIGEVSKSLIINSDTIPLLQ